MTGIKRAAPVGVAKGRKKPLEFRNDDLSELPPLKRKHVNNVVIKGGNARMFPWKVQPPPAKIHPMEHESATLGQAKQELMRERKELETPRPKPNTNHEIAIGEQTEHQDMNDFGYEEIVITQMSPTTASRSASVEPSAAAPAIVDEVEAVSSAPSPTVFVPSTTSTPPSDKRPPTAAAAANGEGASTSASPPTSLTPSGEGRDKGQVLIKVKQATKTKPTGSAPKIAVSEVDGTSIDQLRDSILSSSTKHVISKKSMKEAIQEGKFDADQLQCIGDLSLASIKDLLKGVEMSSLVRFFEHHPPARDDAQQRSLSRFGDAVMWKRMESIEKQKDKGLDGLDALTDVHLKEEYAKTTRSFISIEGGLQCDIIYLALKCYATLGKSSKKAFLREFLKRALIHIIMPSERPYLYMANNHKSIAGGYVLPPALVNVLRDTSRLLFNVHKLPDEKKFPMREAKRMNHDTAFRSILSKAAITVRTGKLHGLDWMTDCVIGPDGKFVQTEPEELFIDDDDSNVVEEAAEE